MKMIKKIFLVFQKLILIYTSRYLEQLGRLSVYYNCLKKCMVENICGRSLTALT